MSRSVARARVPRGHRRIVVGLVLVLLIATVIGVLGLRAVSWSASSLGRPPGGAQGRSGGGPGTGLTSADGVVPDRATVFDDQYPGVAELEPRLRRALRAAATDAAADRVTFLINSGWRSRDYQDQLLREAVADHGSLAEAARWVATADTSPHVSGDAVDLGSPAAAWLSRHGSPYGLCQIYRNEPWHYERRPRAVRHGCPPMYADPTHDPRMES